MRPVHNEEYSRRSNELNKVLRRFARNIHVGDILYNVHDSGGWLYIHQSMVCGKWRRTVSAHGIWFGPQVRVLCSDEDGSLGCTGEPYVFCMPVHQVRAHGPDFVEQGVTAAPGIKFGINGGGGRTGPTEGYIKLLTTNRELAIHTAENVLLVNPGLRPSPALQKLLEKVVDRKGRTRPRGVA